MKPTKEEQLEVIKDISNEVYGDPVHSESDTSWRHGEHRTEVYKVGTDYFSVNYLISTDGETNELRDDPGFLTLVKVVPKQVSTTEWVKDEASS